MIEPKMLTQSVKVQEVKENGVQGDNVRGDGEFHSTSTRLAPSIKTTLE
jgi:hypothetical protein